MRSHNFIVKVGFFFFFFFFFFSGFFLLFLGLYCLKSSVKNSRFMLFYTQLLETRDLCGITVSNSANTASRKRVFKAQG